MQKSRFESLINDMLEMLKFSRGLYRQPRMTDYSDEKILCLIDPRKSKTVCEEVDGLGCKEIIYDTEKLRIHVIENTDSSEPISTFFCSYQVFNLLYSAIPNFLKVIKTSDLCYIIAYEIYDTEEDTEYYEEYLLELVRVVSGLILASNLDIFSEPPDPDVIRKFIQSYVTINTGSV